MYSEIPLINHVFFKYVIQGEGLATGLQLQIASKTNASSPLPFIHILIMYVDEKVWHSFEITNVKKKNKKKTKNLWGIWFLKGHDSCPYLQNNWSAMLKIYMLTFFSESGSSLHSLAIFLISSEFFASMKWNKNWYHHFTSQDQFLKTFRKA